MFPLEMQHGSAGYEHLHARRGGHQAGDQRRGGQHLLEVVEQEEHALGVQVGFLLGGAILTETVFSWPGLGSMMVRAIQARDYPLVQGGVLLIATTFVVVNLIVDLLYAVFDPRIRYD